MWCWSSWHISSRIRYISYCVSLSFAVVICSDFWSIYSGFLLPRLIPRGFWIFLVGRTSSKPLPSPNRLKVKQCSKQHWKKNRLLTAKTQAVFDEGCLEKAGLKHKPASLPQWTMIIPKYSLGSMPRGLIINQHQLSFATAQLLHKNWKVLRSLAV